MSKSKACFIVLVVLISFSCQMLGFAQLRRGERKGTRPQVDHLDDDETSNERASLPPGVRVLRDISYGDDRLQRFDVYLRANAKDAPVIFMVHGGAWRRGDKRIQTVVQNKVATWVPRGFIFISTNYRLVPEADPLKQADDVARALAAAQAQAKSWGGNPSKFIVMGHSAGAHLVALLAVTPLKALAPGVKPWLGTVLLDSGALDLEKIMNRWHAPFYDTAFGKEPAYWQSVSPFRVLSASTAPLLAVCSTRRQDSCSQAQAFVAKAVSLGSKAKALPEDLSHKEINETLGTQGAYTTLVETFMGSLDASVVAALAAPSGAAR